MSKTKINLPFDASAYSKPIASNSAHAERSLVNPKLKTTLGKYTNAELEDVISFAAKLLDYRRAPEYQIFEKVLMENVNSEIQTIPNHVVKSMSLYWPVRNNNIKIVSWMIDNNNCDYTRGIKTAAALGNLEMVNYFDDVFAEKLPLYARLSILADALGEAEYENRPKIIKYLKQKIALLKKKL